MAAPSIQPVEASADTSFLIALCWLDLLPTLSLTHTTVWVAERVWREFTAGASAQDIEKLRMTPVISRATVSDSVLLAAVAAAADGGESEAITLALEKRLTLVLIDDYRGRKVAQRLGLQTRGVLGHLLLLKRIGFVASIKEYIEVLQTRDFRLSQTLIDDALRRAGEQ